jgi:hypothetical protein
MELRTGRVIKGAIVLDEDEVLEEGTAVAVWITDPRPVRATDEELELVRKGIAEADRGELVDARAFLRELQRRS